MKSQKQQSKKKRIELDAETVADLEVDDRETDMVRGGARSRSQG